MALVRADLCTECKICIKKCPHDAIKISNGVRINAKLCNSCGMCESSCMVVHYYDKLIGDMILNNRMIKSKE